jgi:hypothetical protein
MPYAPPRSAQPPRGQAGDLGDTNTALEQQERIGAQELQVRETAQRLLVEHLRPPLGIRGVEVQAIEASIEETFWPNMSLDLTGAYLVGALDWGEIAVHDATLRQVTFSTGASFISATFFGDANFARATFSGPAEFGEATFYGAAYFIEATFSGDAKFHGAIFGHGVHFEDATFFRGAWFDAAISSPINTFDGARVLDTDNQYLIRYWPNGWAVCPDARVPTRGTLVRVGA